MFSKLLFVLVFASTLDAILGSYRNRFNWGGRRDCRLPTIDNGRVRIRPNSRLIRISCVKKYTLVGSKYAICRNGTWDESNTPVCIKNSTNCELKTVENGIVVPTYNNAYVMFFCKPEFKLVGNQTVYCDGYRWVGEFPKCINRTVSELLSCDFETPDLCGWRQDEFHDFDWRRWNEKTPSSMMHTGPQYDHTLGKNNSGYYMYIESTSQAENSKARLISPIFDQKLASDGCFSFYYHMYGDTTGGLRVFQKPNTVSFSKFLHPNATDKDKYLLFEKWGDQGNKWIHYSAKLNDYGSDFQIIIEGIRGPDFLSDIAVDDVELLRGENCTMDSTYGLSMKSCANRCLQNDTDENYCGCSINCTLNSNCCQDYFDSCIFNDRIAYPYDDQPSGSMRDKSETTDTSISNTTAEITVTTPKVTITTPITTVTIPKTTVTIPEVTVTTPKVAVATPELTVTPPKTTVKLPIITPPTSETTRVTLSTIKKSIPKLIFKTTEAIIKLDDVQTEKTPLKPVTVKLVTVKPVTVKPINGTPVTTVKTVTTKLVPVTVKLKKLELTTVSDKRASLNGANSQNVSASERTNKSLGISTTSILFLLLGIHTVMGSAVWFLRSARARRLIADLRGRTTGDPEVRYLTSHIDED